VTVNIYRPLPSLAARGLAPEDFSLLDDVLDNLLGPDFGPVGNAAYLLAAGMLDMTDSCLEILMVNPPVPWETLDAASADSIRAQIDAARAVAVSILLKASVDPQVLLSTLEALGQGETPGAKLCEMKLADELAQAIIGAKSE
jgi:hypothetical protein